MRVDLKVLDERLLQPEFALKYGTERSAAVDLRACSVHDPIHGVSTMGAGLGSPACAYCAVRPGDRVKFGAGFAVHLDSIDRDADGDLDPHYAPAGLIIPRSGLGSRGIVISNLVGLIDADYQGEVGITVWNTSSEPFVVNPMDRLCQMLIVPVLRPEYVSVSEFSGATERGAGGFGSTGVA